jgi:uncharacterized membrane-anchored protein
MNQPKSAFDVYAEKQKEIEELKKWNVKLLNACTEALRKISSENEELRIILAKAIQNEA